MSNNPKYHNNHRPTWIIVTDFTPLLFTSEKGEPLHDIKIALTNISFNVVFSKIPYF